jgi:hypothetical protein
LVGAVAGFSTSGSKIFATNCGGDWYNLSGHRWHLRREAPDKGLTGLDQGLTRA